MYRIQLNHSVHQSINRISHFQSENSTSFISHHRKGNCMYSTKINQPNNNSIKLNQRVKSIYFHLRSNCMYSTQLNQSAQSNSFAPIHSLRLLHLSSFSYINISVSLFLSLYIHMFIYTSNRITSKQNVRMSNGN